MCGGGGGVTFVKLVNMIHVSRASTTSHQKRGTFK